MKKGVSCCRSSPPRRKKGDEWLYSERTICSRKARTISGRKWSGTCRTRRRSGGWVGSKERKSWRTTSLKWRLSGRNKRSRERIQLKTWRSLSTRRWSKPRITGSNNWKRSRQLRISLPKRGRLSKTTPLTIFLCRLQRNFSSEPGFPKWSSLTICLTLFFEITVNWSDAYIFDRGASSVVPCLLVLPYILLRLMKLILNLYSWVNYLFHALYY